MRGQRITRLSGLGKTISLLKVAFRQASTIWSGTILPGLGRTAGWCQVLMIGATFCFMLLTLTGVSQSRVAMAEFHKQTQGLTTERLVITEDVIR